MAASEQATALIGVFADRRRADHFMAELRHAGFREDQIGMAAPHESAGKAEEGAVAGALTGGAVGALAAAAVVAGLIPGIGPVLVGGLLVTVLATAATGAAAGGALGTLVGLGIPEHEARHYEQQLQSGRTLVVVQPEGRFGDALALLRRCEAEDAPGRGAPSSKPGVEKLDELP